MAMSIWEMYKERQRILEICEEERDRARALGYYILEEKAQKIVEDSKKKTAIIKAVTDECTITDKDTILRELVQYSVNNESDRAVVSELINEIIIRM